MAEGINAGPVADIEEGEAIVIPADQTGTGDNIAVFNDEGNIYALDDTCTHEDASLADGYIEDGEVECPLHSARFCLKEGTALCMPATVAVKPHRVEIRDGDVWVFPGEAPQG
ncbi:MAG: bifunctional 3-phenylpropionate/cinnamic acid dioxygenase ferredoxin subunit [Propionibacteriaceae bacterium]|nr:bifunctional 3-phenylpropionate/cinnamic acid dioxygenase ferredoxin subunit [Propionibacteriaceae bacterium]